MSAVPDAAVTAAAPDDYAKYGQHAECVFEFDTLREHFREQFPPCPICGCRTSDDADSRDCGCDIGCNDGEYPPGVNVLIAQAAAAEREACAQLAEQSAKDPLAAYKRGDEILRWFADLIRARGTT